jgi:hypothetical protein
MRYRPLADDERGAVVIIVAAALVAMVVIAALVVDIGAIRADRRVNRSLTDVATRAGVGQLQFGPWAGVCNARQYLLGNGRGFSSFDPGSEKWSNAANPATAYGVSPCANRSTVPYTTLCAPNTPSSWARFKATALGGEVTVEIQSGYVLPDPRFSEDAVIGGDIGKPEHGSCDNLAVIVTQLQRPLFAGVIGIDRTTTRVRSVARINSLTTVDYQPALLLLEQHDCNALQTGGSGTQVIAQPYQDHPGVIQVDSDGKGNCSQPILNGQETTAPNGTKVGTILACSARTSNPTHGCNVASSNRSSRVGVFAKNFNFPPGKTEATLIGNQDAYADTNAIPSPLSGRRHIDVAYRQTLVGLENTARSVLTGNSGRPPGCAQVLNNSCTGNGLTWFAIGSGPSTQCPSLLLFQVALAVAQNVWFNCSLTVATPLTLAAADSYVVVTGRLDVNSALAISDPRSIYIGGESSGGNPIGLQVGSGGVFAVNAGVGINAANLANSNLSICPVQSANGNSTKMIVGDGAMKLGSGGIIRFCQTFVDLASGFDKLPSFDGAPPCDTPCSGYRGTIDIGSGAFGEWSAPNVITGRRPNPGEMEASSPFEDLALWTESGGSGNSVSGQSGTKLAGIFFMGNAKPFNLAGGGSVPVLLSAQFISRTMRVTGNGTVNLVPNPFDSVPISVYTIMLVR